jgi:hypothetical protein
MSFLLIKGDLGCASIVHRHLVNSSALWMDVVMMMGDDDDADVPVIMTLMLVLISDADGVADHLSIRRRYPYR